MRKYLKNFDSVNLEPYNVDYPVSGVSDEFIMDLYLRGLTNDSPPQFCDLTPDLIEYLRMATHRIQYEKYDNQTVESGITKSVVSGTPSLRLIIEGALIDIKVISLDKSVKHKTKALIDTGATICAVSQAVANKLSIKTTHSQNVEILNGKLESLPMGQCHIEFPWGMVSTHTRVMIQSFDGLHNKEIEFIIGRDVLQYWRLVYDGKHGFIEISDE